MRFQVGERVKIVHIRNAKVDSVVQKSLGKYGVVVKRFDRDSPYPYRVKVEGITGSNPEGVLFFDNELEDYFTALCGEALQDIGVENNPPQPLDTTMPGGVG